MHGQYNRFIRNACPSTLLTLLVYIYALKIVYEVFELYTKYQKLRCEVYAACFLAADNNLWFEQYPH